MDILYEGVGIVCVKYTDASFRVFKSTLNTDIVENLEFKDGYLIDIKTGKYVLLDDENIEKIEIVKNFDDLQDKPKEVDLYVNQYL